MKRGAGIIWGRGFIITLLIAFSGGLSGQSFEWAGKGGLWAFDYGYGIGTDDSGNVYVGGKYEKVGAEFGDTTVDCRGNHDAFVAKYNSEGEFKWVRTGGGVIGDYAHDLVCDENGNVYASGEFEKTAIFDNDTIKTQGGNDIFIVKYNTHGKLIWLKQAGNSRGDRTLDMALSGNDLYLTGHMKVHCSFGDIFLTSNGQEDVFVAMYDTAAKPIWAKSFGGALEDEGTGIDNDRYGNVYVTGSFEESAEFDGNTMETFGKRDIFLVKYDKDGNMLWYKKMGGQYDDFGHDLVVDKQNDKIYLTGRFRHESSFGNIEMESTGSTDIFIARLDLDGNPEWVKQAGGEETDYSNAIALDSVSNVYITGSVGYKVKFDTVEFDNPDEHDVFVASYDANGNFRWVLPTYGDADEVYDGGTHEAGRAIDIDYRGDVVIAGSFRDDIIMGDTELSGWKNTDMFVAKIHQSKAYITLNQSPALCEDDSIVLHANTGKDYQYQWEKDDRKISGANGAEYTVTSAGRYTIVITIGNNTYESPPIEITDHSVNAGFTYKTLSDTVAFIPYDKNADSYSWRFGDGTSSTEKKPLYIYNSSGLYEVFLLVKKGDCMDSLKKSIVIDNVMSIDSGLEDTAWKLFPNPTDGVFYIEGNISKSSDVEINIYNISGQKLFSKKYDGVSGRFFKKVDIKYPSGTYIFTVTSHGKTISRNFVLE